MCGFGGELGFTGSADTSAVARMAPHLAPRGPDASGRWANGPLAVLHHRLKIIDLSDAGAQPFMDESLGYVLVFNGCIYNHHELRDRLSGEGYTFHSKSDTEVIAKAFHKWGKHCVERFYGMFAFALYDTATGTLTLARDRLGIKPLYVAQTDKRLRFASTLPALLAAGGVDTSIDPIALHHYMSWHSVVPAPRTILSGVRKLPPATVRTVNPDGRSEDLVYWTTPVIDRRPPPGSEDNRLWSEQVHNALRVAVERRMVSDVPVGVLLSGGLDSSLIVALLAEAGQQHVSTFSIGFESAAGETGDEFEYSDLIAKEFGTDHHRILISTPQLGAAVTAAVAAMSEPMVSHDCVAFHLLSEAVTQHVRVVQCGQGADELFAGYDWYPPLASVPRDQAVHQYRSVFFDRSARELTRLVSPEHLPGGDPSVAFVQEHFERPGAPTTLDAALRIDGTIMLVDDPVKRVDNMTMAWGLEARVPFLDHELVELATRCPPALKLADGGKGILKSAARGVVPDAVIDRPKGYFPVPGVRHLSGELLDMVRDALTSTAARDRALFRSAAVTQLLADPNTPRTRLGSNVCWQLGLLELWLQTQGA